jgi:hypothetical protein
MMMMSGRRQDGPQPQSLRQSAKLADIAPERERPPLGWAMARPQKESIRNPLAKEARAPGSGFKRVNISAALRDCPMAIFSLTMPAADADDTFPFSGRG